MCPIARLPVRSIVCSSCRNISVLVIMGAVSCFLWLPRFGHIDAGLQTRFRTFDTGFICASAIRYYISNTSLDKNGSFIFPSQTDGSRESNNAYAL
jgi:hypothetical protein